MLSLATYYLIVRRLQLSRAVREVFVRLYDEGHTWCAKPSFGIAVLDACRSDFPLAADGRVLLPFKRLFFLAWAGGYRV